MGRWRMHFAGSARGQRTNTGKGEVAVEVLPERNGYEGEVGDALRETLGGGGKRTLF